MMDKGKLTAGITMGDSAGIGPEVVLKALKEKRIQRLANFLIIGNSHMLEKTARLSKIKLMVQQSHLRIGTSEIGLLDLGDASKLVFGQASIPSGKLALDCIQAALKLIKSKKIDVLITAPVNKHIINQVRLPFDKHCGQARLPYEKPGGQGGHFFTGHTEYLAQGTKTKNFAMMLVGGGLKVVLVTTHIALKDLSRALTKEKIYQTLRLTAFALRKYFGISHPRIGVCGLNPHCGDEGTFGWEEAKVIQPATKLAERFAYLEGPLPADSLFYLAHQGKFDGVVAMYHDQGLIPLKMLAFHQGVNLTLGLPFVRTSPDHGTAYDIAGKNKANPGSMVEAIKLAVKIGNRLKRK